MPPLPFVLRLPDEPVAHSPREPITQNQWHLLLEHSSAVAELAEGFATSVGLSKAARLIGMWHDAGKARQVWQRYLLAKARKRGANITPVTHSEVGAAAIYGAFRRDLARAYAPALCIACHHSGLKDNAPFRRRMRRAVGDVDTQSALAEAHALLDNDAPIEAGCVEDTLLVSDETAQGGLAMRLRMLHSCLVDADYLDTERHFAPDVALARGCGEVSLRDLSARMAKGQRALIQSADLSRDINKRRAKMHQDALDASSRLPGFFSLTMPTGAGKTRTAMSFALNHAVVHGQRRVIVAIPFTSIIEQNAKVYRGIFGEDAVLEHHSSTFSPLRQSDEDDQERSQRLGSQNWDAPIVVTTNVQLFESLFSNRNSKLRKLHRIANSVIVLDEVQTLPPHLLRLTLHGLRRLVEEFGCTVVFSTATQPAFTRELLGDDWAADALDDVDEIIERPEEHFEALKRVDYLIEEEELSWDMLAERLGEQRQALVIVNTVRDSLDALSALLEHYPPEHILYISTRLFPAHRTEVLTEVHRRLAAGEPCVLVSTQVVEAGVDIDFPVVWRARGPLDSMIQAAGRCNREDLLSERGLVVIFDPEDGGIPPGTYKVGRDQANILLAQGVDLDAPSTITSYFQRLYHRATSAREQQALMDDELGLNFEAVANVYRLIEDDQASVLVRRLNAPEEESVFIGSVLADVASYGLRARHLRVLSPYMVSIRHGLFESYQAQGLVRCAVAGEELYEWVGGYDPLKGVVEPMNTETLML